MKKPLLLVLFVFTVLGASRGAHSQDFAFTPPTRLAGEPLAYPELARRIGLEALIFCSFNVAEDGSVQDYEVHYSTNTPEIEDHIREWILGQRYEPAVRDGKAIPWRMFRTLRFALTNKERGASRYFGKNYRSLTRELQSGNLEKVRELLNRLDGVNNRSLYEELFLQRAWADYEDASGNSDGAYARRKVVAAFYRSNADVDAAIATPEFYFQPFVEKYRYEAQHLMLGDAQRTLQALRNIAPTESATSAVADHLRQVVDAADGIDVPIEAELRESFSRGQTALWDTWLFRRAFRFAAVDGALDRVSLYCDTEQTELQSSWVLERFVVPESYGDCRLYVAGEPGTSFTLMQLAD
uniref:Ferric siderophore transport system, periplasmic binding protein TonB n=1 Tax=Haliea sp. ETY-M TaxID=1055105 RepID=A0A455R1Z9_9GAMM|nr:ferric siderophore transport system, periplasmic binding protein TonB [Haliea sp. ETY-M]